MSDDVMTMTPMTMIIKDTLRVSGKLLFYPSPNPNPTLTYHLGQTSPPTLPLMQHRL